MAETFYVMPIVKFTAEDSHWPIQIRLIALSIGMSPPPPSTLLIPSLCWNTRLPFNHFWLVYLFAFGPIQMPLTAWWRHSGQKRLIASTARAAWQGFWRTGTQRGIRANGFLFPPSSTGRGAGAYWQPDPVVGETLIDGTGVLRCQAELD